MLSINWRDTYNAVNMSSNKMETLKNCWSTDLKYGNFKGDFEEYKSDFRVWIIDNVLSPKVPNIITSNTISNDWSIFKEIGEKLNGTQEECVCGADSTKIPWHSDYCKKYINPMGN